MKKGFNVNFQEDVTVARERRKRRRTWILAGTVCTIILLALGIAAINIRSDPSKAATLSLEDILDGKVIPASFNATWISDTELLYTDHNGNLVLRTLGSENISTKILLSANELVLGGDFELSADRKYLKIGYAFQKIYRYSHKARYTIVDLNTSERSELSVGDNFDLLLAIWAPTGNAIVFVFDSNIYFKESVSSDTVIQITKDGNGITNGIPDWVYEEEVFSSNKAMWFSPDGTKLAYARFDDRNTSLMVLPIYGEPGNLMFQYPKANVISYPKVGAPNPLVSLHCVDLNTFEIIKLDVPNKLSSPDQTPILTAVQWASDQILSAIWANRIQNNASIVTYLIGKDFSYSMEVISNLFEPSGWLHLFQPPVFSKEGSKFALILSYNQGKNLGSYRHIVLLSKETPPEPLTKGTFVVTKILGWHHDRNEIFYLANTEKDPAVQHFYSVSVNTKQTKCLSCRIKSKNKAMDCLYNFAEFSTNFSYYALTCAGPDVPDISIYSIDGKKILDWDHNKELQKLTRDKAIPRVKRMAFEVDGGFRAQVTLRLPPQIDISGNKKYPMLISVYAGPDSFQVTEKFYLDWGSYLAANRSIIYATIDGRGSGLKGDKMLFASYKRIGTVEIMDQINVTRQIQERLPYVDASKTAVWGWSYGGYSSGMMLAKDDNGIFKCGISVAPVTDWTLYDSIYTERFMGLNSKDDNFYGYRNANLLFQYEGIRGKQYFLIHGTYDDNVHYQQSMLWAKTLEQHDILFRQLSYPDENHDLLSVRPHLYHSLEDFVDECFTDK